MSALAGLRTGGGRVRLVAFSTWAVVGWIGLVAVVYGVVAFGLMPHGVFWSPDSGLKYVQMQNTRWDGGLQLAIAYPGRDLDPDVKLPPYHSLLYRVRDGQIYGVWLPYFPLVSKLPFRLFGDAGLLVLPVLSGLVTAGASYWLARLLRSPWSWAAIPLTALLTPVFVYSVLFWEHIVLAALATAGLAALLWGHQRSSLVGFALAGALLGLGFYVRPEAYIFTGAALLGFIFHTRAQLHARGLAVALAVLLGSASSLRALNLLLFGSLLSLHEAHYAVRTEWFSYLDRTGLAALQHLLVGEAIRGSVGLLFLVCGAGLAAAFLVPGWRWRTPLMLGSGLGYAGAAVLVLDASGTVEALNGLLAAAPVIVFALAARRTAPDRALAARVLWTTALLYAGAISATFVVATPGIAYMGALEWGPRALLPVYPLLAPLVLAGVRQIGATSGRVVKPAVIALALALSAISLGIQAQGVSHVASDLASLTEVREILQDDKSEALVTDLFWLGEAVAPEFYRRRAFLIEDQALFPEWLARARASGLKEFLLVTFVPGESHPFLAQEPRALPRLQIASTRQASTGMLFIRVALGD